MGEVRAPTHASGPIREGLTDAFKEERIVENALCEIDPRFAVSFNRGERPFRSYSFKFGDFLEDSKG